MAGSQLKKLRSELKSKGLIGQTNVKSRNKKNKTPSDTRKSDKQEVINEIRSKFNVFDSRVNRVKRDVSTIEKGKFVKLGANDQNNPTKSNSFMNKSLKTAYELHKNRKGKNGKVIDRRFGENSGLTQEEKMLQRFVKERESQSKRNKFSLESDEEDDDVDFTLTHSGKVLGDEPEAREEDSDVEMEQAPEFDVPEEPGKRKSKADVMKEVIAKSKFYKAERQKLHNKTQNEIDNLDDNFQDIWFEMGPSLKNQQKVPEKKSSDISYDEKVRGLVYDKRSVPADKTKTDEQIQKEYTDKMNKLEDDRLKRMEGDRDAEGDDLDEFWENDSQEEEEDEESGSLSQMPQEVEFPLTLEDFTSSMHSEPNGLEYINKIIKTYKPNLREGNKDRMNKFVSILFKYTVTQPDDEVIKVLKKLSESYNEELVSSIREEMLEIQARIATKTLKPTDLVFFNLCGLIFSTSDKYHLIVIPNLILMNEILSTFVIQDDTAINIAEIGQCIFVVDSILQYQRISKRYEPEVNNCLIRVLRQLLPIAQKDPECSDLLSIQDLFKSDTSLVTKYVNKIYNIINRVISTYKELSVFKTVCYELLECLEPYQNKAVGDQKLLGDIIDKLTRLHNNAHLMPLTLQAHRKLAIKMLQPKFEENFNPTKNYDLDLNKSEINKMKKQLKKEQKETLKDIRKQNAFETNEKLSEKVKMYDEYHSKMASIVNSISTIEGKERNDYEKEKKRAARK